MANNNAENIKLMLDQLYLDRYQTGDITFIVKSERIRAHRCVLAALSPKYKAQFYGPNHDEGEIRIPIVSAAAFKEILQFFYKESVDLTMDNIEMVLDLAKQSLVDGFVEICVNFLKKAITTNNNVCSIYRLAIMYDIESLRLDCEQQISTKTIDVFASVDFLQCNRHVLMHILKLDTFNCSETDVFDACIAWARADCRQKGLNQRKPENLRSALGVVIYQVRFSSINPEEFAALHKSESLEGFFSADELIELLYITTNLKGFKSQKFNESPRSSHQQRLQNFTGPKAWSLECNRIDCTNGNNSTILGNNILCRCDIPIRLHGFVLNVDFDDSIRNSIFEKVNIKVKRVNETFTPFELECKIYRYAQRTNETMIVFKNPIEQIIGLYCDFCLLSVQSNCEVSLKRKVVADNIEFSFNGGWITRLLFDKLEEKSAKKRKINS